MEEEVAERPAEWVSVIADLCYSKPEYKVCTVRGPVSLVNSGTINIFVVLFSGLIWDQKEKSNKPEDLQISHD